MSKAIRVGQEFQHGGFAFKVCAVMSDRPGLTQAVVQITRFAEPKKAERETPAPAPGLASQMLTEALDPLKGARHLGYLEGLRRGAELCEAHGIASGRTISVLIRNHAEAMRKDSVK